MAAFEVDKDIHIDQEVNVERISPHLSAIKLFFITKRKISTPHGY